MQILHSDRNRGLFKVLIQGLNDLWILYTIIRSNDIVGARTHRRVVMREGDKGERKPMYLDIRVENVEFHEFSNRLRIKGKITKGPDEYISIGQYHTINIEIGTRLTIIKEKWLKHEIRRLEKAKSESKNQIILVNAIESGLSTIGLISNYSLSINSTIRHNIPGKRYSKQNYNLEIKKFLDQITQVIIENIKKFQIQLVVICGPGFIKEQYQKILREEMKNNKININIKAVSASSGTESAINEIIKNGTISSISSDHQISIEVAYIEEFITRLGKNSGLYSYGFVETMKAAEMGAIEHLLVTDNNMRTISSEKNKSIGDLFKYVEKNRGIVHIISTLHPAGEQLQKYSGIVSLLRYKVE